MSFDFDAWTVECLELVNRALDEACPSNGTRLRDAMRYSLLAGGKRIRPLLCLAACEAVGGDILKAVPAACSLEMVHTFSLIHDDLPAMDDDDLRRGVPTCHKMFDEATAILAGDALLSMAFYSLLSAGGVHSALMAQRLADVCIVVCEGQSADLDAEGSEISLEELRQIHLRKTGALLDLSVDMGAIIGQVAVPARHSIRTYGSKIGVAFQIVDDILDVTESSETLGKPANSDLKHDKATYPKLVGLEESRHLAREALSEALEALQDFDEGAEPLRELARRIVERNA